MYRRSATRTIVWVLGLILVVAALLLLFFETGLSRFVPFSLAVAGLLLIIGVAVMGMADRVGTHDHHDTHERDREVVEHRYVDETHGHGGRGGHHHH